MLGWLRCKPSHKEGHLAKTWTKLRASMLHNMWTKSCTPNNMCAES